MEPQPTNLYLVPTPIGNLEDITLRALRILKEVDLVLAEDTRTSRKLFQHYDIDTKLESYHIHNEHKVVDRLVERIEEGKVMALISDAGTPSISDPGFLLTRACLEKGLKVECLPGATAFVPALVKSGFPNNHFAFQGFLPHKKGKQTFIKNVEETEHTTIVYESPHRLVKTLKMFVEFFEEDRQISVSREITKLFEETITGTSQEVLAHYEAHPPKGEIVIVVNGKAN